MGRTLLSVASDFGVEVAANPNLETNTKNNSEIKSKTKTNGSGQECPLHTAEGGCPHIEAC